jgi:carboxyl-terminal processing protease
MPDFFVPLDTTQYTRFHRQLAAKSIIINANLRYIDKHRNQLKRQYATFDIFNKYFQVPQSVIDDMLADAKKQKVEPKDDNELRQTMPMLRQQVKALIARDLWDMSEYFAIINEENHIVKKALDVLQGH